MSRQKNKTTKIKHHKSLFAHQKGIKPLPTITHPHEFYVKIPKLTSKQFGLYQSVLDHVAGRTNFHHIYAGVDDKMFDELRQARNENPTE